MQQFIRGGEVEFGDSNCRISCLWLVIVCQKIVKGKNYKIKKQNNGITKKQEKKR